VAASWRTRTPDPGVWKPWEISAHAADRRATPPIPVEAQETLYHRRRHADSVTIHVFQGERPMARETTPAWERFNLDGLPPAPSGIYPHPK